MAATIIRSPSPAWIRRKQTDSHIRDAIGVDPCCVDVEFIEGLSIEQVSERISQLSNPQVIIWYIGCYGLRETSVQFYRDFLIAPILRQSAEAVFWLVDLTAWGAFKSPQCSIDKFNSCCNQIEQFPTKQIKCIKSSEIFKKMQELSEKNLVDYFREALHRDFISQTSKHFPKKNIRIKDFFPSNCPLISDWNNHDTNQVYSVFQYLEGCLLIDNILARHFANESANYIEIVFALPNDEIKYYKDKKNSFQKDVAFLISKRCADLNIQNVHLDIKFLAFRYGIQPHQRPYNAPGKILKSDNLFYEKVVGHVKCN